MVGTLLSGGLAKPMYEAYRKRARELGWEAGADRMAYAAIIGVGDTPGGGAAAGGYALPTTCGPRRSVAEPFTNPPGITRLGRTWRC